MLPSPRPPIDHYCASWTERFVLEREALQRELARQIGRNMANIVGHAPTADLLLVASDGHKFHAHSLILRKRAPNFFRRYVQSVAAEATTPRGIETLRTRHQLLEVGVDDVDSNALSFFIRSIYTEEEVSDLPLGHQQKVGHQMDEDEDEGATDEQLENGRKCPLEGMANRTKQKGTEEAKDRGTNGQSDQRNGAESAQFSRMGAQTDRSDLAIPMTSFLELAEYAEQQTKREGRETPQQRSVSVPPPSSNSDFGTVSAGRNLNPKFIPLAGPNGEHQLEKEENEEKRMLFPIFIGMDGMAEGEGPNGTDSVPPSMCSSIMAKSLPSTADASESPTLMDSTFSSIRGRAIARRRLSSVSSLISLCSVDLLTPAHENVPFASVDDPQKTASKLATDLLQIYTEERDAEEQSDQLRQIVLVETKDGAKLRAPLCTVWANCEYFRTILSPLLGPSPPKSLLRVPLLRFSSPSVHFLLQFLHGGLCSIPSSVSDENPLDVWELFELGAFVRCDLFLKMLALNVRALLFHFFHRPCVACVSAVFDALPKMESEIPALRELFDDALQWQAANFTRIWKGRVFLHLSDRWHKQCRDALLQSVDEENVVGVLLGCEKLQVTLPRLKSTAAAQRVLRMLADVEEYCLELIRAQFDSLISSRAFRAVGKGLALNLSLLEDILPSLVHSLSADTAIRSFIALKELLAELDQKQPEGPIRMGPRPPSSLSSCDNSPVKKPFERNAHFGSSGSIASGCRAQQIMASEWNPRFKGLCHRLANLLDRHMLHFASAMLDSDEWDSLGNAEQARIREFGLFVELKMPRASLPRLSSLGRVHKRSSSVGVGPNGRLGMAEMDRTRSLERKTTHGHATVTSRPSLSTQIEEEMATTTTTTANGKMEKTDGDEKKRRTNWEEDGRKRRINSEEEEEGRRRRTDNGEEQIGREKPTDRKRSAKTQLGTEEEEEEEEEEETGSSLIPIRGEMETVPKPSPANVKDQPTHLGPKIVSKSANTSVKKSVPKKHSETLQKENDSNKKSKSEQKQRKMDEGQTENAKVINGTTPLEEMPSSSSAPQQLPVPLFDRQRTHTVMTVEENVRAGIVAYMDTMGRPNESGRSRSKKPQSIVRPMPQQQKEEEGVPLSLTAVQQKRPSRTMATKKINTAPAQNQIASQTGNLTKKKAMTERERRTVREKEGRERGETDRKVTK